MGQELGRQPDHCSSGSTGTGLLIWVAPKPVSRTLTLGEGKETLLLVR